MNSFFATAVDILRALLHKVAVVFTKVADTLTSHLLTPLLN